MTRLAIALAVGGLALVGVLAAALAETPAVTDARIGIHGERTRFVLEMSASADFDVFTLSNPYRVVVDFPEIDWRVPEALAPGARGLVSAFRYGRFRPGTFRLVLDLTGPAAIESAFLLEPRDAFPHRFVLDLTDTGAADFAARSAALQPSAPAEPIAVPRLKPRPDARHVVVIDAGHGGVDPGATGVSGTREKDIVLKMAHELKRTLESTGNYQVVLTREGDSYLQLRDRFELARKAGGELFISLHADSHPVSSTRGASVYTLSETASDKEAAALAEKENKSDVIAGIDLSTEDEEVANILIDLARRETMNTSAVFARELVDQLDKRVSLLRRSHRFAGFAVLKAPDVPSVLVELGYLSNREEERLLRSADYRARIAASIRAAIDAFFAQRERYTRS